MFCFVAGMPASACGEESRARAEEDRAAADTIDQLNHQEHSHHDSDGACAEDSQSAGAYAEPDVLSDQYPHTTSFLQRDVCDLRVTDAQSMQREYLDADRRDEGNMILPQYRREPYQYAGMFQHAKTNFAEDQQYHLQQFSSLTGYHEKSEDRDESDNRYEDILVLGDKQRTLDMCSNGSGRSSEGLDHGTPPGLEYPDTKEGLLDLHLPQAHRDLPANSFVHLAAALHSPSSTPSQDQEDYGTSEGLHRLQPAYSSHSHPHQQEVIQHSNNYQQ